jgi:hypothetical protein
MWCPFAQKWQGCHAKKPFDWFQEKIKDIKKFTLFLPFKVMSTFIAIFASMHFILMKLRATCTSHI